MKVVLATIGSLGDIHPMIALGLELQERGHEITFAAMEYYREKIGGLGFKFHPMAPHLDPNDVDQIPEMMDANKGTEKILRGVVMPNLRAMYDDLQSAVAGADLLVTGELVYAAKSVAEISGIKWITTSLAPISLFSAYDPSVPPPAAWFEKLRPLGSGFHRGFYRFMRWTIRDWYGPYKEFRRELGLSEDHDPIFEGKYSSQLHLAMFSRVLGRPQPDWPAATLQTGFCFYDGQSDTGTMPGKLVKFLETDDPPIVFTLGSAAVMDARDFFKESARAAKILSRRAVLLYGRDQPRPNGLSNDIAAFEYAPYSLVFRKAACVVHQGGVGTTGQVLRAGVPQLVMPYGHDQPDNAARCRRIGVAEVIDRDKYTAANAMTMLRRLLSNASYSEKAVAAANIVRAEHGTVIACDGIEDILKK